MSKETKKASELQGINHLIVDATIGVTDLVEAMQKQIVHPPLLPSTGIQKLITKIASIAFKNFRWSTLFVGKTLDKTLGYLNPAIGNLKSSDKKEFILSILNGVIGDYLAEKENPLEIEMHFVYQSKKIKIDTKSLKNSTSNISGKIILMVHGSCMNANLWTRKNHNHGEFLAKETNETLLYLNYNSGKHVSTNGKEFNELLENLTENWPVPVEEITIINHSMGGLVTRSALFYGEEEQKSWTNLTKKIVFLGTPHHGSHIERKGNYLDLILESVPYAKPFAKLGKIRSAGVTDLRYGNLVDEDWQDKNRFELKKDYKKHIPLSENIEFYSIAAVFGKEKSYLKNRFSGDSLVSVKSALGKHKNSTKNLDFKKENTFTVYENNHSDLLSNPKISKILKKWLQ
jgi:pimeloyl-ACP methyl ester carboxylesterase